MHLTINLASWTVPVFVTVLCLVVFAIIASREKCGDYGFPVFTFGAGIGGICATLVAWAVFIALRFFL